MIRTAKVLKQII